MNCTLGLLIYDRTDFIYECLYSLVKQKYKKINILISVDYSENQEKVLEIIFDFKSSYTGDFPIEIVAQKQNLGAIKNHQFLLRKATGDYFCWVSDDDVLHQNFVLNLVSILENQNNQVCGVFPAARYIDKTGKMRDLAKQPLNIDSGSSKVIPISKLLDFPGQCFWSQLGILRREMAIKYALYPIEIPSNVNTYTELIFLTKVAFFGEIIFLNEELLYYRVYSGSRYQQEVNKIGKFVKYTRSLKVLYEILKVIKKIWSESNKKTSFKFQIFILITLNFLFWPLKSVFYKVRDKII